MREVPTLLGLDPSDETPGTGVEGRVLLCSCLSDGIELSSMASACVGTCCRKAASMALRPP